MEQLILKMMRYSMYLAVVMSLFCNCPINSNTVQLNDANIQSVFSSNEVVLVNFYADWCRFSQILAPIFDEAAVKAAGMFPQGKVALAKVDCDQESGIAAKYHISKYPTLKLFRNGEVLKKEYRGQRSADAFTNYLKEQIKDTIIDHGSSEELEKTDENKRRVIGYFENKESEAYKVFAKVASGLRDDCEFHTAIGPASTNERQNGDMVIFRAPHTNHEDVVYTGGLDQMEVLKQWATDKCIPLVREITFENAEELAEEGIPFLILFHRLEDTETPQMFRTEVEQNLKAERSGINFLTADGKKFSHPLHHLGKSESDLPVLAIDSFRHMYLFPHDVKTKLNEPGLLKQFIADLHSGKLHREFHHGPDPTQPPPPPVENKEEEPQQPEGTHEQEVKHVPNTRDQEQEKLKVPTSPPESLFKKLAPSRNRYTILRDEL